MYVFEFYLFKNPLERTQKTWNRLRHTLTLTLTPIHTYPLLVQMVYNYIVELGDAMRTTNNTQAQTACGNFPMSQTVRVNV